MNNIKLGLNYRINSKSKKITPRQKKNFNISHTNNCLLILESRQVFFI